MGHGPSQDHPEQCTDCTGVKLHNLGGNTQHLGSGELRLVPDSIYSWPWMNIYDSEVQCPHCE